MRGSFVPSALRLLPLVWLSLLSGCSPVYVLRSAAGHIGFAARGRSIDKLLADPKTSPETREKLELVAAARTFAFDGLGLERSRDYSKISRVEGGHVTSIVMAAKKTSFTLHRWWFPFIGKVPYKGHFSLKAARRERRRLEAKGFDVYVGGVSGYNTPLWFGDPLAHTELERPPGELVELVLHELTHGTLFFRGHVDFSEGLASFVGERAAQDFLAARFGKDSAELAGYRERLRDGERYAAELARIHDELDLLYRGPLSEDEKLSRRDPILAQGRERLCAVLGAEAPPLNNAFILAHRLYRHDLALFAKAHERLGGEWKATVEFFRSLDRRDPAEDLERRLGRLRAGGR